jgi:hypothetical protein
MVGKKTIMNLEQMKQDAIKFYKMAYEGQPRKAVEQYVGDDYMYLRKII